MDGAACSDAQDQQVWDERVRRREVARGRVGERLREALTGTVSGVVVVPYAPEAMWWKLLRYFAVVSHLGNLSSITSRITCKSHEVCSGDDEEFAC